MRIYKRFVFTVLVGLFALSTVAPSEAGTITFKATATLFEPYGTIPSGDTLTVLFSIDDATGLAISTQVSHPTKGSLSSTSTPLETNVFNDAFDGTIDAIAIGGGPNPVGTLGGIAPGSAIVNHIVIDLRGDTSILTSTNTPTDLATWNAFTQRTLALPTPSNPNATTAVATIGDFLPFVKVDPAGTYLLVDPCDQGAPPTSVTLSSLGIVPGDFVRLTRVGAFQWGQGFNDDGTTLGAVFSGPAGLLSPGAGGQHIPFNSGPTACNNIANDIAEDFNVDPQTVVQVPVGASEILFTANDSFWSDNTDPNNDYGVWVEVVVPQQYVVINTNNSGAGSLRQAILDARSDAAASIITFDPTVFPATINVTSLLPPLNESGDSIDGARQVTLNGVGLTATSDHGLRIRASNITITGLTVQNFGGSGIRIQSDPTAPVPSSDQVLTGIVVSNNIVGKNLDGIVLAGGQSNNQFDVTITGNTLTQNSSDGIVVNGSDSTGAGGNVIDVTISNNTINGSTGSDSALSGDGIRVTGGQGSNIGNNVIRALITDNSSQKNASDGILVAGAGTGSSSSNNQIDATITGNISKTNGFPNGGSGIIVVGGPTITVPATTSGNLITFLVDNNQATDNTGIGMVIMGNAGSSHVVRGSVTNNQFNSNSAFGIALRGRGSFNTLENIDIQLNQVTKNGDRGLVIFGGDSVNTDNAAITNVLLNGNTVSSNGHHGIVADLGTGPGNSISFAAITNNTANANGAQGIWILSEINGNGTTPFAGNRADRNKNSGWDGINISSTGYFLTGNNAQANARFGITAIGNTHDGTNVSRRNGDPTCDPSGCF